MPACAMGPPCNCQFCRKSKFRQCTDLCETMRVGLFNYFWLDLKSWEIRKQYVSTLVDKIPIKQKGAPSNRLKLLVCHEESSVTGFLPLLVITNLLQLLPQKLFLLKPNLLKYLIIKCHKNVKNSQQDSLNHLQQLNLIIVVQNIEIESLWNLEQNLYREYSKQTTTAEIHCLSYPLFDKSMKDCNINITIFLPKKRTV